MYSNKCTTIMQMYSYKKYQIYKFINFHFTRYNSAKWRRVYASAKTNMLTIGRSFAATPAAVVKTVLTGGAKREL